VITLYALRRVPPFAQGVVRDLRVRWALQEAGLPYERRLLDAGAHKAAEYRRLQPFGQVPAYEEDGLVMFESGAILLHIAERSPGLLMPTDAAGRAQALSWLLAALNSVEVGVQQLAEIDLFHANEPWIAQRRPQVEAFARMRLQELADCLYDREYLGGTFTIGDLMMATVLRIPRHTALVTGDPVLGPYLARCEARPAFQRALAEQLADFAPWEPPAQSAA
jgi:glutathione S-transferase